MPAAAFRSSPFSKPFNPAAATVWTSCPARSRLRRCVTHSSSSSFTIEQPFLGQFQDAADLFAGHGGKLFEKLLNCFAIFEAIKKVLDGNTRAAKDGCAAHLLWVDFDKICGLHRSPQEQTTSIHGEESTPKAENLNREFLGGGGLAEFPWRLGLPMGHVS